jgi:hypothetical protein
MSKSLESMALTLVLLFRYDPDVGIVEAHMDLFAYPSCLRWGGLQGFVHGEDGEEKCAEYQGPTLLEGRTLKLLSGNRTRARVHRVSHHVRRIGVVVHVLVD